MKLVQSLLAIGGMLVMSEVAAEMFQISRDSAALYLILLLVTAIVAEKAYAHEA